MSAICIRPYPDGLCQIACLLVDDRTTRDGVDTLRPSHPPKWFCRNQLSGIAIDNIEKAVLWGVKKHAPLLSGNGHRRQLNIGSRIVIPAIAGRRLIVPKIP